jgi:hypothetical protein
MPLVMQDWSIPKTKATSILRDSLTEMIDVTQFTQWVARTDTLRREWQVEPRVTKDMSPKV